MTIKSYTMGPGTFKLGVGLARDASCQVTSLRVEASETIKTDDAVDVLCGEQLAAVDTVTLAWKLTGTLLQDIAAADLVAYTWANASAQLIFEFIPNTAAARKVTGTCRIVPIALGGDAKARPTSDIDWAIIGTPVLAATP